MADPRAHTQPFNLISLLWRGGTPDGRAPLCKRQTTPPRPPLVIRLPGSYNMFTVTCSTSQGYIARLNVLTNTPPPYYDSLTGYLIARWRPLSFTFPIKIEFVTMH